ncbi:MAG: hypothetical protein QOI59_1302 [Gammaproteobacteria bacterium]|nr:hypothetical protein [Gammaproteobacteria bacterium]
MDRPGYDRRYREIYPRKMWHLCRTVFSIVVERAAKFARDLGRPLRVFPEKSAKDDEGRIKRYYTDPITQGLPFNANTSGVYAPLVAQEFRETLIELRFKAKSSPGTLIETRLTLDQIASRGTKYSCFELVDQAQQ